MTRPPFTSIIEALPHLVPFVGPEQLERERGCPFRARLGANELAFGASPAALAAMRDSLPESWKYADPENHALRSAIAAHHDVDIASVVVGEGIDGLLGLACMLFVAPGAAVVTTAGAYPTFDFHVRAHGGRIHHLAMDETLREDVPRLLDEACRLGAPLVYVSNPNNPVGSFWTADALSPLLDRDWGRTVLLIDEAYAELAPADGLMPIDVGNPHIIRLRTFSKAYGLAGIRVGYALGAPDVIAGFNKVRNHYGVNRTGQIGALAALADQSHLDMTRQAVIACRQRLAAIAGREGLEPLPSEASFVAMRCPNGVAMADQLVRELAARDVFIRKPIVAQLADLVRVSVGPTHDIDVFEEVLPLAIAAVMRQPGHTTP